MYQVSNLSPFFKITRLKNNFMEITLTIEGLVKGQQSAIVKVKDFLNIERIQLKFNDFDMISYGSKKQPFLEGCIGLEIKYIDNTQIESIELISLGVFIENKSTFLKTTNKANNIASLRQNIISTLQEEFLDAYSEFEMDQSLGQVNSQIIDENKSSNKGNNAERKQSIFKNKVLILPFYLCAFSLVAFLTTLTYNKYNQGKANQNLANISNTTSAKSEQQMLDNAFKEIGIDRKKITNDLSCFKTED